MIIVDRLDLAAWAALLPRLARRAVGRRRAPIRLRYFDASPAGRRMSRALARAGWIRAEPLDYAYVDVQDADGGCVGPRVETTGVLTVTGAVRRALFEESSVVACLERRFERARLLLYLQKALAEEILQTLMRVHVVARYQQAGTDAGAVAFLARRTPWHRQIAAYAEGQNVTMIRYGPAWRWPRTDVGQWCRIGLTVARAVATRLRGARARRERPAAEVNTPASGSAAVAVSYQGKGVTLDPGSNSDLFWLPFARLAPDRALVYFSSPDDPLDDAKLDALARASVRAVATRTAASTSPRAVVCERWLEPDRLALEMRHAVRLLTQAVLHGRPACAANLWIASRAIRFIVAYNFWRALFRRFGVTVNVDYNDWSKERLPADQAIADLGGISVSYQRAYEPDGNLFRARATDVHFAFSPTLADTERQSGSRITDLVAVGYVLDYAIRPVRPRASEWRRRLEAHGARFILAFFDENSGDDKRKLPSHEYRAENYRYLLERLLEEPEIGMIFKPKKPATLRRRLGPVASLLDRALATGRCLIFEEGAVATPVLPCEAGQAADVAIGLLFGASAALESALAGTRTLLLDREGVPFHPLYALGKHVVFRDWDSLWTALTTYRLDPTAVPDFGDWSPLATSLDPFRDGRAAERMGEYIGWLAEDLDHGYSRAETLERVRARYAARWGEDNVMRLSR